MSQQPGTLRFRDLRRRFDRAAAGFDSVDFVQRKAAAGLSQRLGPMLIQPKTILDLGSATGTASFDLRRRFRRSRVIAFDASLEMLRQAAAKRRWFSPLFPLQGDANALPLQNGSVDLVYSNLLLPFINDSTGVFTAVARVLRKGGLFVFSTLGPDSLSELRGAWSSVDDGEHIHLFADMHDIGDGLVRAGLADPVLDTDYLDVSYRDTESLYRDLTVLGARNCLSGRSKALTGKGRFRAMEHALRNRFADGLLSIRLELVFGHAWGSGPRQDPGEYRIHADQIGRRRG